MCYCVLAVQTALVLADLTGKGIWANNWNAPVSSCANQGSFLIVLEKTCESFSPVLLGDRDIEILITHLHL